jgi:TPR repeat protein
MMGKRIDSNDANAMYEMYLIGEELTNLKQGVREAFKFYHRAADLGSSGACRFLSIMYGNGHNKNIVSVLSDYGLRVSNDEIKSKKYL